MKIKSFLAAVIFFSFSILVFSQVKLVQAGGPPSNPPFVPISFPSFYVSGNVSLKGLNRLLPIPNVTILATKFRNNPPFTVTTKTNQYGNYSFYLPPGLYQIEAVRFENFIFTPPRRYINVNKNLNDISFFDIIRPRGRG